MKVLGPFHPPLGMNESGSRVLSTIQLPPRTTVGVVGPLRAPSTPKCASRLRLPSSPAATTSTTSPMSNAAGRPAIILRRWGRAGLGSGGTSAGAGVVAANGEIGRHTSELQSHLNLVCRLLLEKKKEKCSKIRTTHSR